MRAMKLFICMSCQRHVRATETRCPFCRDEHLSAVPVVRARGPRAALLAAAAIAATVDCGARTDIGAPEEAHDAAGCDVHAPATLYGLIPFDAGCK